jgi:hypothetical protein
MDVARTVLGFIQEGGGQLGWLLACYLLWRLHQVTDRQYRHAVETSAVLAVIKTLMLSRARMLDWEDDAHAS